MDVNTHRIISPTPASYQQYFPYACTIKQKGDYSGIGADGGMAVVICPPFNA